MNIHLLLLLLLTTNLPTHCAALSKSMLTLDHVKENYGSISSSFLDTMHKMFSFDIFVETGTFLGHSTNRAAPFCKEVHTIELSPIYYSQAKEQLNQYPHVYTYLGDSTDVLPTILPNLQGKILFWLDGHYSTGNTAKGKLNTPIVQELLAIKDSGIKNAIILIDDLRCFQHFENTAINAPLQGYPNIKELIYLIKSINTEYEIYVYGDTLLAFLSSENVIVSPVIKSCTISRIYEPGDSNLEEVLEAEKVIIAAHGKEREVIESLIICFTHSPLEHKIGSLYRLWQGLLRINDNKINEGQKYILEACMLSNFQDQRMHYYLKSLGKKS